MSIEVYRIEGCQCDDCETTNDLLEINVNKGDLILVFCNNCIDELMDKLREAR